MSREAEENPQAFLSRFQKRVILDEVQYVPSLFRELKIRIDEERELAGKWILTGSQQLPLMEKLSESLAGRVRIMDLGTLTAHELKEAGLLTRPEEQLWKGGLPEIWESD